MMCLNQKYYRRLVMLLALVAFVAFSGLAEAAPWRFAVLGDQRDNNGVVGVNTPVVQAMVNDIVLNRGVSLALVGGDQIHGIFPTPPSNEPQARLPVMYRNWRAAMGQLLPICYPVRGNHETYSERYARRPALGFPWTYNRTVSYPFNYLNYLLRFLPQIPQNGPSNEKCLTYSFAHKEAFFAAMDQFVPGNEFRVNQGWLDQKLAANILPHVFVYAHAPAVAVSQTLPTMACFPLQRDVFWESLSAADAKVYFSGHSHLYNRATVQITDVNGKTTNPITQLIVGGGGGPLGDQLWNRIYYSYQSEGGQPNPKDLPGSKESVTHTLENHVELQYGYAIVTVDGNQVSITYYAGLPTESGVPDFWYPADSFNYTVTSKTLGRNDVNQTIAPQILTNFYSGIAITKTGAGILTLNTGASSYSEPIRVAAGQLSVYGAYASAPVTVQPGGQATLHGGSLGDVTVNAGGILNGAGMVAGNLVNNGYACPDLPPGPYNLQVTGDFTQTGTGKFNVDIATASNYGRMQVGGNLNLGGDLYVSLPNEYWPAIGQSFTVITASGALQGTFRHVIGSPPNVIWGAEYSDNTVKVTVLNMFEGGE
jgi:autotransporter-associated beta strand protein